VAAVEAGFGATSGRWRRGRLAPASHLGGPSRRAERIAGLAMTLPALAFFAVFVGYPITQTILIGFQRWNAISAPEWIGLENYRRMLDDPVFRRALILTLVLTAAMTFLLTVLPMLVAVLFAQGWGRFGTLYRTILFIPSVISWVVTGGLWRLILEPNLGSLNSLLSRFGLEELRHNWLGDPGLVKYVIVVVAVWQQLGLYVVIFYAGLQSIDPTLYEAARVDGASGVQQLRSITVPMLRPVTLVVITLNLLNGIKLFDVIWVMTEGGPVNASQVLGTYMYRVAFANPGLPDFGYGSALSTVILVLCLGAVMFQINLSRRSNV
jgi:ABC-type sugar transport system permease subunit